MTDAGTVRQSAAGAEAFLGKALTRPLEGRVRVVTVPAPAGAPEALLRGETPATFWATHGGGPVHAGVGAAAIITGSGPDRFRDVRAKAEALLAAVEAVHHPDVPADPVRVFGGFSFLPGNRAPEWQAFGDATFVLPRFLYTRHGEKGRLAVAFTAEDLDGAGGDRLRTDLRTLLERLASPAPAAGGPAGDRMEAGAGDPSSRAEWDRAVASIQRRIEGGAAAKIVAARSRSFPLVDPDIGRLLRRLDQESATAARFAFRIGEATFLGATPERLVTRTGLEVRTEALAGSVPADSPEREARLLQSLKDEAEHDYVVRAIVDELQPLCTQLDYPAEPRVQRLRHVLHLQTRFVGRLRREIHVLELAERLHPTPAVGGLPTAEALDWIEVEEPGSRGWYAAPVGWFDARGDGEFGVALRSGLIHDGRVHLFAGAGIVRGSDAAAEFEETEVKLRTMLDALEALA